jgi:hypothetical protein
MTLVLQSHTMSDRLKAGPTLLGKHALLLGLDWQAVRVA